MKCEICKTNKYRHKHHIISKCYGGTNEPYNIALLCANCHHDVHSGAIVIEGRFLTTQGYMLIYHKSNEKTITNVTPKVFTFK